MKPGAIRYGLLCSMLSIALFGVSSEATYARARSNADPGIQACYDWCGAHNKTIKSLDKCLAACTIYYCVEGNTPDSVCVAARFPPWPK